MILTPEEELRRKHQEKMAKRRRQVFLAKLAIVGGTALAVFLIVVFLPGFIRSPSHAVLSDKVPHQSTLAVSETSVSSETILAGGDTSIQTESSSADTTLSTEKETKHQKKGTKRTRSESELAAMAQSSPYAETLISLANESPEIWTILEHMDDYPPELQKMVAENPETLDFVLSYPEKKGNTAADTIGQVTKGTIPLLLQWDDRWGYQPYGKNMIGSSGFGPTCIAMVAAGLTGRNDITPARVASYSMEEGFLTEESDTRWELMSYGCEAFGITGTVISLEESVMAEHLTSGSPVICSMRPGDFTSGGHFIVLTGYQDGYFQVHDPNSTERSQQLWSFETLKGQIKQLWSYSLCDK